MERKQAAKLYRAACFRLGEMGSFSFHNGGNNRFSGSPRWPASRGLGFLCAILDWEHFSSCPGRVEYFSWVLDLQTQLNNFKNTEKQLRKKLGSSEVKALLSTTVYMFSIGTKDYMIPFTTTPLCFNPKRVCCPPISRALKLVNSGGSSCMEEIIISSSCNMEKWLIHNSMVKKAFCSNGPLRGSINYGQKAYLLCDNVNEYIYFNGIHPTEKANYQVAKLKWNGSPKTFKPCNLKLLFEK
ncbi:hypothetical protein SADUNF_Sadunf17G0066600 [Salix dunnii]|uniref:Uncharacterized protein n=1 Tax=Salix dunnii TaxID=1413687 RepID=A0A835J4W0_9ROSI|nr:hypothetical protein SADUNF_Sadunf17G0066600 [Salix dunnii]